MQWQQQPGRSSICAPMPDPSASRTRPFRVQVEQAALDDLRRRLELGAGDQAAASGADARGAYLHDLLRYWRTVYDWRYHEARLNAVPQLIARVEGEDLHVAMTSRRSRATPLLLLHGWPDAFYRFHKVVPLLSDLAGARTSDPFDVVIPSLPGFPFTGALRYVPREQAARHTAHLIWKLMTNVLGFDEFAVAGCGGGSAIAQLLAVEYPESIIGIHLTDLGWHPEPEAPGTAADSPVELAAWIVDQLYSLCDGDIESRFSTDDVLTIIMLYWVSHAASSAVATYAAELRSPSRMADDYVDVPVGVAVCPTSTCGVPVRALAEQTLNVQRWTEMPRAGHFAALEAPELYAADVVAFFRSLRAAPR
jgi:pimeloyl-ACP methyl ester carboxylesterase